MKLLLTPGNFQELIKKSYSLDHIYLLKLIEQNFDIEPLCEGSMKISALQSGLIRKGLITDENKLTLTGQELLVFIDSKDDIKLTRKKNSADDFDTWWKTYPGTDTFTHNGKSFKGSRSLRHSPNDCRLKFNKILNEGEYTAKQLIDALEYDVLQKKEVSKAQGVNKLTYMQNSLTYLNQRSFESFIELINEGIPIIKQTNRGTDI